MFTKVVQIFNETYYFIAFCLFIEVREPEQWISPSGDNEKMYDLWIIGDCVYNKLCDSFSKTVSEFIINDVIPFMAFCAEIWQQKRLRFPLEVAAFSLYTDDSYLIRYREIDMSCCNIVLSLRTDQSWLYVAVHVIHYSRCVERQTSFHWLRFYRFIIVLLTNIQH